MIFCHSRGWGSNPLINVNYKLLLLDRVGHSLVDRSCHSIVGEVAPPCEFIFTALVTMGGPPVPEEGISRKCQVGTESFFKPAHPLLGDASASIIRSHQRFQWAKDVPTPPPLELLAAVSQEPPHYWG